MRPAVLASLSRSQRVESVHRGAVAVVDAAGELIASAGPADRPCYFRSACKPLQLVPAVEAGVAERFGLDERRLAVMVASHSGAPRHLAAVREILAAIELGPEALGCGYHRPRNEDSLRAILDGAPPSPLYNNCSGKHAGMLALCRLLDAGVDSYLDPGHPAQRAITERLAAYAGLDPRDLHLGTDGCSAPTLYAPLGAMAGAFARYARELARPGSAAAAIGGAMARAPEMLGEEDSFQVVFSRTLGDRLVGKYGAEGLFCVAVAGRELGIAVRVEDGAPRAVGSIVLDILIQLGVVGDDDLGPLERFRDLTLTNWRGTEVGTMRSDVVLSQETQASVSPRPDVRS